MRFGGARRGTGRLFLATLTTLAMAAACGAALVPRSAPGAARLDSAQTRALPAPTPRPDEWWVQKWGLQQQVWPHDQGGGVTVAVLDSGVQASVSGLRGAVVPGTVIGGHGTGETDADATEHGHGTQMASLIAGRGSGGIVGVAPRAKILPVRLTDEGSLGMSQKAQGNSLSELTAGINYAVRHGAGVINVSGGSISVLGDTFDCGGETALQNAIDNAVHHNVVVVAASGNTSQDTMFPEIPAGCAGALAVGGVDQNGSWDPGAATGTYVDVDGPFQQVAQGLDGRLYRTSGTSGATALISGEVALIKSAHPGMSWDDIVSRVTTQVVGGWSPANRSAGKGYGVANIPRAVNTSPGSPELVDPAGLRYDDNQLQQEPPSLTDSTSGHSRLAAIAEGVAAFLLLIAGIVVAALSAGRLRRRRPAPGLAAPYPRPYPVQAPVGTHPAWQPDPGPKPSGRSAGLGLAGGVVAVVAAIVLGFISYTSAGARPSLPRSALSASACSAPLSSGGGNAPLTFARPRKVCGLPADTTPSDLRWAKTEAAGQKTLLRGENSTRISSTTSGAYATPYHLGSYRRISFIGYTGKFSGMQTIVDLLYSEPGEKQVSAGPHGGVAGCAQVFFLAHCAWATSTTAGEFWLYDSVPPDDAQTLTGGNIPDNLIRIRNALEVPG